MRKNAGLTLLLSFIPGLSFIYLGQPKKAWSLLIISAGIFSALIFSHSILMRLIMAGIYCVAFLPAAVESYQIAKYGEKKFDTNARWYINILLFCTGFTALPLLWSSDKFGRKGKIAWTVAVPIFAGLYVGFLVKYWDQLDGLLRKILKV